MDCTNCHENDIIRHYLCEECYDKLLPAYSDLLEACKLALDNFEVFERDVVVAKVLKAAIARAEGHHA